MLEHWVWLSEALYPGGQAENEWINYFDSAEEVFGAAKDEISAIEGIMRSELDALCHKKLKRAEEIVKYCAANEIEIITYKSEKYPQVLKNIYAPPAVIYKRGSIQDFNGIPMFTIVGTRKSTKEGERTAFEFACRLSGAGCTVVSGMADGIDAAANRGAIAGKTPTVAVLGCGVDVVYPAGNAQLMEDIIKNGAVISEFPPGAKARGHHFPIRNRIMAALGMGVLVVEAPEKSGALITANLAAEDGKDVFAVPGSIYNSNYAGSNNLIKSGCIPVTEVEDIVPYLPVHFEQPERVQRQDIDERLGGISEPMSRRIAELLFYNRELHIDEIARMMNINETQLLPSLMMLEVDGVIRKDGGNSYVFVE